MTSIASFKAPKIVAASRKLPVSGGDLVYCAENPQPCSEGSEDKSSAVVLIHGWSSNRHSLAPQFDFFLESRRTVALDLRGHGDSATVDGPYSVAQFADDLRQLCAALELDRPVLVGHSMGGAIALEACLGHPGLAAAVVLLDGYGCYPDSQRNALGQMLLEQVEAVGFAPVMEQVVDQVFFLPGANPELVTWVKGQLTKTDSEMAVEAYRDLLFWDGAKAAAGCVVPVLNLVSTVPFNQPHRFSEICPKAVTGQTVGAGHFHGIEVPDQVHPMVSAFLAQCLK